MQFVVNRPWLPVGPLKDFCSGEWNNRPWYKGYYEVRWPGRPPAGGREKKIMFSLISDTWSTVKCLSHWRPVRSFNLWINQLLALHHAHTTLTLIWICSEVNRLTLLISHICRNVNNKGKTWINKWRTITNADNTGNRGFSEWLDEKENYVNYYKLWLWPSESVVRQRSPLQNTRWENIFWRNGIYVREHGSCSGGPTLSQIWSSPGYCVHVGLLIDGQRVVDGMPWE